MAVITIPAPLPATMPAPSLATMPAPLPETTPAPRGREPETGSMFERPSAAVGRLFPMPPALPSCVVEIQAAPPLRDPRRWPE